MTQTFVCSAVQRAVGGASLRRTLLCVCFVFFGGGFLPLLEEACWPNEFILYKLIFGFACWRVNSGCKSVFHCLLLLCN